MTSMDSSYVAHTLKHAHTHTHARTHARTHTDILTDQAKSVAAQSCRFAYHAMCASGGKTLGAKAARGERKLPL